MKSTTSLKSEMWPSCCVASSDFPLYVLRMRIQIRTSASIQIYVTVWLPRIKICGSNCWMPKQGWVAGFDIVTRNKNPIEIVLRSNGKSRWHYQPDVVYKIRQLAGAWAVHKVNFVTGLDFTVQLDSCSMQRLQSGNPTAPVHIGVAVEMGNLTLLHAFEDRLHPHCLVLSRNWEVTAIPPFVRAVCFKVMHSH